MRGTTERFGLPARRGPIPILRIGDTLLASVQVDLNDSVADAFQEDLVATIEKTGATGVLIDITALTMVDSYVARVLAEMGRMARLMGARTVLVGIQAEVAATLVRMGYALGGVDTALDVEDGLARLGYRLQRAER
jgi:rsbT antagonist protein RsbS